jgi:uncharacterized damage-inducible protein DinB
LLTIGGLIKHVAHTEEGWIQMMLGNLADGDERAYADSFTSTDAQTLQSVIADLNRVAAATEAAVAELDDVGVKVQLPKVPRYPEDPEGSPAR